MTATAVSCVIAALVTSRTWAAEAPGTYACALPVVAVDTGTVLNNVSVIHSLPDGGVLIVASGTLLRYDPTSGKAERVKTGTWVNVIHNLPDGGVLMGVIGTLGLQRFDARSGKAELLKAVTGTVEVIHTLPDRGVLIGGWRGLFRFDARSDKAELVQTDIGPVIVIHNLPDGGVLLGGPSLFRFDPRSDKAELIKTDTGPVNVIYNLPDGGVLLGTIGRLFGGGLFRFDPRSDKGGLVKSVTGRVNVIHSLPDRRLLIGAEHGLFRFDARSDKAELVRTDTGPVIVIHNLPDGGVLIGAERGLYSVPSLPLSTAKVELLGEPRKWVPETDPTGSRNVQLLFRHPCAPDANSLDLRLSVSRTGSDSESRTPRARPAANAPSEPGTVVLEASARLDKPGEWTLQLLNGDAPIGKSMTFQLAGPTIREKLTAAWKEIVTAVEVALVASFVVLLWRSHRSVGALRMLLDPAWGTRLLTWPFFLLRHVPAVQRWIFEPWFQNLRRAMPGTKPAFLDPPVTGPQGGTRGASELLAELASRPRVWLQGRTGMGKSAVFAAWERGYYADCPTLAAAAARYGFILVTLPVRHYAAIDPPEAKAPESWVVECVRRRFEQFGVDLKVKDAATLEAMLRAGHIAIGLDGTNEADRKEAIAAFARQYPMVRLIATSQSDPDDVWDTWHLPPNIGELRAALLRLWLGDESGAVLEQRLVSEGVSAIVSGYDLRLVADLARNEPATTPLPRGRVELYRAVIAKVVRGDGDALDLLPLRNLALRMLVAGRREFSLEEGHQLGDGVTTALARDGVHLIRRAGKAWEFRHDQMRAFLAASSLAEDAPTVTQLIARVTEVKAFGLRRDDQEVLWGFVAEVLRDEEVAALWVYAQEDPGERGLLQAALQRGADRRKIRLVRPEATDASEEPSG